MTKLRSRLQFCRASLGGVAVISASLLSAQVSPHVERDTDTQKTKLHEVSAAHEAVASFSAGSRQADDIQRGEVWFSFEAVYTDPGTRKVTPIQVRVPVSSTEYPYGEERSCDLTDAAHPRLTFSAGLDEKNFLPYGKGSGRPRQLSFSLNKYLCRVLAAPFRCGTQQVELSRDLSRWTFATEAGLTLSAEAPATLDRTPIRVAEGDTFDIAQCAKVAPSNGLCCVQGKTTEWHCGGTPAGRGWHQVSGECFHRETGGTCKD